MLKDLILKNRSYRKFDAAQAIERSALEELVDLARLCPSGGNLQPLKYKLSCDQATNDIIFPCLRWAGYMKDWEGPEEHERPSAYIIILRDNEITSSFVLDHGIAVQTMKLAAVEQGLGGCIMGNMDRKQLRTALEIPNRYEIMLILALGHPTQEAVVEDIKEDDVRYWEDDTGVHHVPKRLLSDIILK